MTVAAGIEDAIFSARATHRRLVVYFGHGAVIIANATLQVGVFRSYCRKLCNRSEGGFCACGEFLVAGSALLIPWNHVEPRPDSVAAAYDRRTRSAACLGGHRPPLQVSQFPTLGSVDFHVSRQPAWRDQEVCRSIN
jgi:hypothetical protein